MAALAVDPPALQVPASAFKIRSSNNENYRLKPVYGFVEPGAASPVEVTRTNGPPKDDKLVVQFIEVPAEATDAQEVFKSGVPQGEVILPMSAQ
uniref:MSP domain-containing protein n=1 Tax=Ditylenchus dipsaci TaxID=166011 RepID=A0A915EJ73_9BILA